MPLPDPQTIDSYGGVKEDAYPDVDPITTESAAEHNALTADVSAMTRMSPRATCRFVAGEPPSDPGSGLVHEAMWGHQLADKPVIVRDGFGTYRITWPMTVTNELGTSTLLNLRWARAYREADVFSADPYFVDAAITGPNTAVIRVYNASGSLDDASGTTFSIDVY